jgi:polygalacturonase
MKTLLLCSLAAIVCLSPGLLRAESPTFNVLDYGAKNDGSAPSTEAFRKAIEACAKAGGGTVTVPAGNYVSGHIELVSNLVFHLDAGATIRFLTDLKDYPLIKGRYEGTETITPAPLIGGRNLENVAVTGRGILSAENAAWRKLTNKPDARAILNSIIERLDRKEPVPPADYEKAASCLRPALLGTIESKNVLIEGIHIVDSSFWSIHLLYSTNVVVRNIMIETYGGANTDGIDIDSSSDIRISDSYFDTGDDGIVIKSGKNADGRRVNRPTENVSITNCTVHRAHGAVVIGSETSGGIRNIVASNIVSDGTEKGIRIKSTRGRGSVVENLRFDNWVIRNPRTEAIQVTNYYTSSPAEPASERTPVFRNIAISNVTVIGGRVAVSVEGLPEMPVEGLRLSDVVASSQAGLRAFNTSGLELHNVRINAENGVPFLIRDSTNLDLDGVQTRNPKNDVPVVRLDRVKHATLRNSVAWPDTNIFLSLAPGMKTDVSLTANDLGAAKTALQEFEWDPWKSIVTPDRSRTASR